jgi:hypothetical protein
MNTLFLIVCGISLVFFGYFFAECHRDRSRRKPRGSSVVEAGHENQAINLPIGQHSLKPLDKQMAAFLIHHRPSSADVRSRITPLGLVARP